jgi:hypothetical protein
MADDRLRFLTQNFGGVSGGSGISSTIKREVKPDTSSAPQVAQPNVFEKVARVVGQVNRFGADAASTVGRYAVNTAVDVGREIGTAASIPVYALTQPIMQAGANRDLEILDQKRQQLNKDYQAGKVSKQDYLRRIGEIKGAHEEVGKRLEDKTLDPFEIGKRNKADLAEDVVGAAIDVLSAGKWSLVKQGAKEAGQATLNKVVGEATKKIEQTLLRVPSAKELITRNTDQIARRTTQRAAGETMEQYMVREGKQVAVGLLVKRPLFYQQNVGDATNVYTSMMNGDFGGALKSTGWLALQMLSGGPLGWAFKQGAAFKTKVRELSRGTDSFVDKLSTQIGSRNPAQITRYLRKLEEKAPNEFKRSEEIYRIMQETNLRVADERVNDAVENVLRTYDQAGIARENINPKMFVDDYSRWHEAAQVTDALKGKKIEGLTPDQVSNLVVVRWDSVMKRGLADAIGEAGEDKAAMAKVLSDFASRTSNGWGNNPNLMKQLTKILDNSSSAEEAARRIKSIPTAAAMPDSIPVSARKRLEKLGYGVAVPLGGVRNTPIVRLEDTRKLVTAAVKGNTELFNEAVEPSPVLRSIAGALDKAGLSPQSANKVANDSLRQSLVANLADTEVGRTLGIGSIDEDVTKGGAALLSQLQRYVESKKPLFAVGKISSGKSAVIDVRMLSPGEIKEALGVDLSQAKEVQRSLQDAYLKVPLELRGLGDRVVDMVYRYNPAHKYYARVQSALRYTYNPFFRVQEQVETSVLAKMNANKLLWLRPKKELDEAVDNLTRNGFFEGNLTSAAADDVVFGRINANLTRGQKRNLAGLALEMADRQGKTLDDVITKTPDELEDALRVIVQYPNKGVLASSMARTLNLAFFPMRYNAKVTMLAAKEIAKMPPSLQIATVQGFLKMKDWLKSDEGIRWQSENADAIQVFKWVTPIGSVQQFYKIVTGNVEAPGDLGLLGGLPFGMISQVLDSQGIINLNTPYIDPQSGSQIPDYVPQTARARAAVAMNDLLGTMFSFPGRTLGLPGKEATLRKTVDAFIDTSGEDFDRHFDVENLTPLQKQMIKVLKGNTSQEEVDKLYTSPAEGQFNYYTLPPFDLPKPAQRVPESVNVLSRTEVAQRKQSGRTAKQKRIPRPIVRGE